MRSIYPTFIDNQATLINSDHLQTLWMWKLALSVTYEDDNSIMKHVTAIWQAVDKSPKVFAICALQSMTSIYPTFIDNQATLINSDHLQTLWMWKLAFLSVTYEDDNSIMKHVTGSEMILCETQWTRPPSFSPGWLIQWSMGEVSYITLFSPSDVTAFHRMKYGGGVLHNLVFTKGRHCVSQNSGYITTVPPLKWRFRGLVG